jgi:hypothetical protein
MRPTEDERDRIQSAGLIGAVLGVPLLWMLSCYLLRVEQWQTPGLPTALERSAMAMAVWGLLFVSLLCGPPLGAGVGGAWMASRLGLPGVAGRWCLTGGLLAALGAGGVCLLEENPVEALRRALLPWRGGHLFWSLLVTGWGVWLLERRRRMA